MVAAVITTARPSVPGRHVTNQQAGLYMQFRHQDTQRRAAARAGMSERTARRIEHSPCPPSQQSTPSKRPRRVSDPLDGLWEADILPLLQATPGLRPVTVLEEMQRRHSEHDWPRLRRTLERPARPGAGGDLPPEPPAGTAGLVRLHRHGRTRRQHRRRAVAAPPVSLCLGLLGLGACRGGAGRRKLRRPCLWTAKRAVGAGRRTTRPPHRQPVGGVPQSRAGGGC